MATQRQKKAIAILAENGGIVSDAMRRAGYSKISSATPKKLTDSKAFRSLAERIPDNLLERVHLEGLEAQRVISARSPGRDADEGTDDFIEVPDHAVRHKFLDSAYKLKGAYAPEKSVNLNIDVEATSEVRAAADKLNALLRGGGESSNGAVSSAVGEEAQNKK